MEKQTLKTPIEAVSMFIEVASNILEATSIHVCFRACNGGILL